MTRTRVKICGLTRAADVVAAVDAGVDAVGLVFHPASPRALTPQQAAGLCRLLPPFVSAVGLFVDAPAQRVREVLDLVPLDQLQFHGDEAPEYCAGFSRRWLKAIRMRPGLDPSGQASRYAGSAGLLLDTYDPRLAGGTGAAFDWGLIPSGLAPRVVLAGGLTPQTVADAIRRVRPYAVDVSGGVESAKGIKDPEKITAFMQGVRDGDRDRDNH